MKSVKINMKTSTENQSHTDRMVYIVSKLVSTVEWKNFSNENPFQKNNNKNNPKHLVDKEQEVTGESSCSGTNL